ncbi:MAG: hypothetical protein D6674_06275 [Acidobacteria bacterium]|jgi:hypothetical protein|nr:MAG: hypothetical protein D6674_06275 [Acidobacteriota bacterium]
MATLPYEVYRLLEEETGKEKADIARLEAEIEKVRAEFRETRAEVKELEAKVFSELRVLKVWLIVLTFMVAFFNRDALGILLEVVKVLR